VKSEGQPFLTMANSTLSAEQKLQQFKILLAQSKFDFSAAQKDIDQAFLAVVSDQQPEEKEEASVQIIKTKSGKGLWVCGPTIPYKDQLKSLGGKWNPSKKAWIFSLKPQQQLLDLLKLTEGDIGSEN